MPEELGPIMVELRDMQEKVIEMWEEIAEKTCEYCHKKGSMGFECHHPDLGLPIDCLPNNCSRI